MNTGVEIMSAKQRGLACVVYLSEVYRAQETYVS